MEKQAFALVKTLKDFRVYVLHSHITTFVPNAIVKDILTQPDRDGRRGKWISLLLEYDLEIKPTNLVKGQGLSKLISQSNDDSLGINFIEELSDHQVGNAPIEVSSKFLSSP